MNPQHLQSLHIKITPLPEHKDIWSAEEIQVLEKFFDAHATIPPYKPNLVFTFSLILNVPVNVLKDFIQIMKLQFMPIPPQGIKWSVQWVLRIPPSATPLVPTGHSSVLVYKNKILFFVSIVRCFLNIYFALDTHYHMHYLQVVTHPTNFARCNLIFISVTNHSDRYTVPK